MPSVEAPSAPRRRDWTGLTLARLVGNAVLDDPEHPAWDDPRFLAWWAEREATRARAATASLSDAAYLAAGRALFAHVRAKRLGVQRPRGAPTSRSPGVSEMPSRALAAAAGHAAAVADTPNVAVWQGA